MFMAIRESVHFHIFIVRTQEVRYGGRDSLLCRRQCEYIQMVVRILNDFRSERQDNNNNNNNNTKQALRDKTRTRTKPSPRDTQNFTEWLKESLKSELC